MRTFTIDRAPPGDDAPRIWAVAGLAAAAAGGAVALEPTLALLGISVLAAVAVMVAKPEWTTYAVVFAIGANVPTVLVDKYGLPAMMAAVIPLLLALPFADGILRRQSITVSPVLALLVVYFVLQLLGAALSSDTTVSLERVKTFMFEGLVIFFLTTNVLRTRSAVRNATWALVVAFAFLGGLTLVQAVTHRYYTTFFGFAHTSFDFYYGFVPSPRYQGPIGDPNYFAQLLIVAVPLALVLAVTANAPWKRWAAIASTVLIVAGIVLTYSRGAVVALAFIVIGLVVLRELRARHVLVGVVALAVVIAAVPSYRARVASLGSVQGANAQAGSQAASPDQSVRARATEMRAALLAIESHPVLGLGPGGFPLHYQEYALQVGGEVHARVKFGPDKGTEPARQAHDLYLSVATDNGGVGLLVFLAIIFVTMRSLLRVRRRASEDGDAATASLATGYALAIVGFLTAGIFLSLAYERYFWLLLGLATALVRARHDEANASARSRRATAVSASSSTAT
jgi:putative inorganic carbon (hco3(-)) transporter